MALALSCQLNFS